MTNTHSQVSLIPVRKSLAIGVPRRKLSELVLYSHEDTDKIVHTREHIITIHRMIQSHMNSVVRRRWDDGSVQNHQIQS